jgi:hypothetical protein
MGAADDLGEPISQVRPELEPGPKGRYAVDPERPFHFAGTADPKWFRGSKLGSKRLPDDKQAMTYFYKVMQALYSKSAALYEAIQGHPDCTPELAAKVVKGRDLRADWESMYVAAGALFKRRLLILDILYDADADARVARARAVVLPRLAANAIASRRDMQAFVALCSVLALGTEVVLPTLKALQARPAPGQAALGYAALRVMSSDMWHWWYSLT